MGDLPSGWLTQTKFMSPAPRNDIIQRRRLLESLHTALRTHPLTLISAPAGYGKTTLLTSLLPAFPDPCLAWISLDEEDNDPARFLSALMASLQRANPDYASLQPFLAHLSAATSHARHLIGALINETLAHQNEIWVVLDDLQLVTEPAIFAALDYWIERMPPQMHLIISTRHDPPLVLARLRASGQLAELRVPDLRFTFDEAQAFFNEKQRLGISPEDLAQLQGRTEGWAAGLRLLAGSLDRISSSDRAAFIQNLAHTDRYVFAFLADEVLKRQEPRTRAFLLETSILPELTPNLCAAVASCPEAPAVLEDLAQKNLFLSRVDENGTAYRYHALFAEFLRTQLNRASPDRAIELHRRAGDAQKNNPRDSPLPGGRAVGRCRADHRSGQRTTHTTRITKDLERLGAVTQP